MTNSRKTRCKKEKIYKNLEALELLNDENKKENKKVNKEVSKEATKERMLNRRIVYVRKTQMTN